MAQHQKTISLVALLAIAVMVMASTMHSNDRYKNLKILPKDISEKQMDSIMNAFTRALKVSCDFCHVPAKKPLFTIAPATSDLDYALDNPMKEEARKMIELTRSINTKYFYSDSSIRAEYLQVVGCNTCHRGNPYPAYE